MLPESKKNPNCNDILAGDLQKGWDSTDRLPERVQSYCNLKERTEEFTDWARDGGIPQFGRKETKLFRKVEQCGQYLLFRNYLTSRRTRLIGACSCKEHLLCAFCAARRGVKNTVAYKERVDYLLQENGAQKLMFLTFTVKNGPDLFERFSHLRSSMQKLLIRRNNAMKRPAKSSMACINGGVFAYEFKRGSGSDDWHPHIHMLVLSPGHIDISQVKAEWLEITGDSAVVNIKSCTDDNAFLEVFAYALKFSEMEHGDRWHAFGLLKGERLISSFGSFRGVDVPETDTDELLDTDEPWLDLIYQYQRNRGYGTGKVLDRAIAA